MSQETMSQLQASDKRRGQRHARSATLATVLGLLLTLGYALALVSPSYASIAGPDVSADQSTGPTDPNGSPY